MSLRRVFWGVVYGLAALAVGAILTGWIWGIAHAGW